MRKLEKICEIKIGFTNYCNRGCEFCLIPRLGRNNICNKEIMSIDELYLMIDSINNNLDMFEDSIKLSLFDYNEPLADMELHYEYATILKNNLNFKNIYIDICTNGDYISTDFEEKYDKYLSIYDRIRINDYVNDGIINVLTKIETFSSDIELMGAKKSTRKNFECKYKNTLIRFYIDSEIELRMKSRGGFLSEYAVEAEDVNNIKCDYIDGRQLMIQWNGSVMACCETSNDIELHKDLVIGNIFYDNLKDIRCNLVKVDTSTNPACRYCVH